METTKENQVLRVGLPCYLNTLPLLHYFKASKKIKLYFFSPKKVNEALSARELDAGLASSLFYAKNFKDFLILPDLSISAVGKVKSVILYHQRPLSELDRALIGISPETETSFGLLRIILEDFYEVSPRYQILEAPLSLKMPEEKALEGYLAIGDEALILQKKGYFPYFSDLAEIWLEKTQLPFIFALFILRKEVAEEKKPLIKSLLRSLYISRAKGLSSLPSLVESSRFELERDFILNYLQHLEYDFSGLKQRAFLYFCEFLAKKEIIPSIPELNFFYL